MSNWGSINSDLPFKLDHEGSRFLKFVNVSGSAELPHDDLVLGYNDQTNTYILSASSRPNTTTKFVIDGVTSLRTTSITSSYTTSSVNQTVLNITSSGYISSSGAITSSGLMY